MRVAVLLIGAYLLFICLGLILKIGGERVATVALVAGILFVLIGYLSKKVSR